MQKRVFLKANLRKKTRRHETHISPNDINDTHDCMLVQYMHSSQFLPAVRSSQLSVRCLVCGWVGCGGVERRGHPLREGWSHSPPVGKGGDIDDDVTCVRVGGYASGIGRSCLKPGGGDLSRSR